MQQVFIRGLWQLSQGHCLGGRTVDLLAPALASIEDAIECGFRTFDCADIYVGVEELLGKLRSKNLRIHTKYVPDLGQLAELKMVDTQTVIERSLRRLKVDCLDLVQFHWWDFRYPRYREALEYLTRLKEQGKIRAIGVTNFDTARLQEVLDAGFDIESIQLQASLVDQRGQGMMRTLCEKQGIRRFGYGSLLGGFFSERWMGQEEPQLSALENRSLVKYKLIIEDGGGWGRFQELLRLLSCIAKRHGTSLSQVAIQGLLQSGQVDAVISGLSPLHYREQNRELRQTFVLSPNDLEILMSWVSPLQGDVYELERGSRHSHVMKMNLSGNPLD